MEIRLPCINHDMLSRWTIARNQPLTTALFSQHTVTALHALPLPTPTPVIGLQLRPSMMFKLCRTIPSRPRMTLLGIVLAYWADQHTLSVNIAYILYRVWLTISIDSQH